MCSIITQFCSQFAPGSSLTFLWHFGELPPQLGAPTPSWELPLPNLPGSCAPIGQPLSGAPITLLHSGSSLLPLGAPQFYKFQDTPLHLSIQSLVVHEYTSHTVKGNKSIVLNLLYHYLNLLGSNQDKKPKNCLQYF